MMLPLYCGARGKPPGQDSLRSTLNMKALRRLALSLACTLMLLFGTAHAASEPPRLTLFWGHGCPHCAQEKTFLKGLKARYPELEIIDYEVWNNKQNAAMFAGIARRAGMQSIAVPATLIENNMYIGFSDEIALDIEAHIKRLHHKPAAPAQTTPAPNTAPQPQPSTINIPFLGQTDIGAYSLPAFTLIIAGLDSFNPCALYVLLFLLSLMVHARSRARMLVVGGTFVFFSGFIYFLFMAAWLNLFLYIGALKAVTVAAGVLAVAAGGINVKDYFAFKEGVSLSIPDSAKPKLFERMRGLLRAESMWAMLTGTVVLAIAANAYELLCTAGFPMLYTRLLTLNNLSPAQYYLYLAFYNMVYVLPLATIVGAFTMTLGSRKLTEQQGRVLKLLSGLMMLMLGAVLLVKPELLNNVLLAAGLLGASGALTFIIVKLTNNVK